MARQRTSDDDDQLDRATDITVSTYDENLRDGDEEGGEPIPQDTLVCALTGKSKLDKPEERILQNLIEQLHREYHVELSDMERDLKLLCHDGAGKKKTISVGIAVYDHGKSHDLANIIRVVLVAKANLKVSDAAVGQLDVVLSNLSEERAEVYGVWTNGREWPSE
jgi:type I restriction enzyme M protein